jgi:hypothetical protein
MKKSLSTLFLLCVMLFSGSVFAQGGAYSKGDKLFNAGISFGGYNYGFGHTYARAGAFIPVNASLEFGVHDYISIGPYVGYASWKYDIDWSNSYYYYNTYRFVSVGARASLHYVPLLNEHLDFSINESKWDFYFTLQAGLDFRRSFVASNDPDFNTRDWQRMHYRSTVPVGGPFLGFKYLFTPNFGAYLEVGRGAFGYGTLGLSAKF